MTTRKETIEKLKIYFSLKELMCNHVLSKFGERAWQFFDSTFLETLLIVRRDIVQTPMIINQGSSDQSGLRCNLCSLVKDKTLKGELYMTSHANGAAIDFHTTDRTAEQVRQIIIDKQDKLPYPIRLEDGVSWVHLDVYDNGSGKKVSLFKP